MTEREFADSLRLKALDVLETTARKVRGVHQTEDGAMAPHVALDTVRQLKATAQKLDALAQVAAAFYR